MRVISKRAVDCKAYVPEKTRHADVAKLVDARDLKSLDFGLAGSIPAVRTRTFLHPFFQPYRSVRNYPFVLRAVVA